MHLLIWVWSVKLDFFRTNFTFSYIKQNERTYNLEYTNKVHGENGRYVRGFVGIEILCPQLGGGVLWLEITCTVRTTRTRYMCTRGTCISGSYPLPLSTAHLFWMLSNQCISIPRNKSPIGNSIASIGDSLIRVCNSSANKTFQGITILFTESFIRQGGIPMRISPEPNPFNSQINRFSFITAGGSLSSEPHFYIYKGGIITHEEI